jgi:hypothetical protein
MAAKKRIPPRPIPNPPKPKPGQKQKAKPSERSMPLAAAIGQAAAPTGGKLAKEPVKPVWTPQRRRPKPIIKPKVPKTL